MTTSSKKDNDKNIKPSLSASIQVFKHFISRYPLRTIATILALLLSGIAEGFGIAMFVPLLKRITNESGGQTGGIAGWVEFFFDKAGLDPTLQTILICIVVGFFIKGFLFWLAMNQVGYTVSRVTTDLRLEMLSSIIHAEWGYFMGQPAGQFANAIASESLKASNAYLSGTHIVAALVQLAVYSILAFTISWQTSLIGIIAGALFVKVMYGLVSVSRRAGKYQVALLKSLTGRIVDMLHGLKAIRAMSRESALMDYLKSEAEDLNTARKDEVRAASTMVAVQEPVLVILMAAGLYLVLTLNIMTVSSLLLIAFLFARLFNQVNIVLQNYQRFASYENAFFSIRERIDQAKSQCESDSGLPAPLPLQRGISFDRVSFGYSDTKIFENISFHLPAKKWTTLIGPSGAGKTSLLDLLVGLIKPHSGEILLDGQALSETKLSTWRRSIGYVPQEMLLLHGSIFENIALGENDLSRAAVEKALHDAGAWEFVEHMPKGIDTMLGERGARLSGGQRQRIALARALIRRPELLILDEATASLDPQTEADLCKRLSKLAQRTTILAISHQPAIALEADQVLDVRDKQVVAAKDRNF